MLVRFVLFISLYISLVFSEDTTTTTIPASVSISPNFSIISYLPEWRYEGANYDTICEHSTHLIFFSVEPGANGDIIGLDRLPNNEILDIIKQSSIKYGCKIMICFGGNGRSEHFSTVVNNKKIRHRFVKNVIKLVNQFEFDGVDYNWEVSNMFCMYIRVCIYIYVYNQISELLNTPCNYILPYTTLYNTI